MQEALRLGSGSSTQPSHHHGFFHSAVSFRTKSNERAHCGRNRARDGAKRNVCAGGGRVQKTAES